LGLRPELELGRELELGLELGQGLELGLELGREFRLRLVLRLQLPGNCLASNCFRFGKQFFNLTPFGRTFLKRGILTDVNLSLRAKRSNLPDPDCFVADAPP